MKGWPLRRLNWARGQEAESSRGAVIRRAILGLCGLCLAAAVMLGVSRLSGSGVETVPVTLGTIARTIVATGRVAPETEVVVANKIPGRIKAVLVKEGDGVSVGKPLVVFDDHEFVTQLKMAEARVASAMAEVGRARRALEAARARWTETKSGPRPQEVERARAAVEEARERWQNAERERSRFKRLLDDGLIARSQYDAAATEADVAQSRLKAAKETLSLVMAGPKAEAVHVAWSHVKEAEAEFRLAESRVGQANAEVEYARAQLKITVLESTIEGRVTHKLVEPGEAVDIGVPLLVLADDRRLVVKAEIDETDVGMLDLGQRAEITADAYRGRVFPGRVIEIGQAVGKRRVRPEDPKKIQDMKVLETKVEVLESSRALHLGMTVDVKIVVADRKDVPVLASGLFPLGARDATVEVVTPAGREVRRVRLGVRDDVHVEVTEGLNAGDRISVARPAR